MTKLLSAVLLALILTALLGFGPSQIRSELDTSTLRAQRDRARLYADRLEGVVAREVSRAERNERLAGRYKAETTRRFYPTTIHALRLASVVYGVSYAALYSVGSCESHLYPFARNGRYRGVFQEGPMFEAGPFGRAGFSVFDPYANVFTAAYTVAQQGWRQWECKP